MSIVDFMYQETPTRRIYKSLPKEKGHKLEINFHKKAFYVYRCNSVSDTIFRGRMQFDNDKMRRLQCVLHNGEYCYSGTAFVTEKLVTASLVRQHDEGFRDFETLYLCFVWNTSAEWQGLYLGQSDAEDKPCSGRLIIVKDDHKEKLETRQIASTDNWSETQISKFLKFVNPKEAPHQYALISDVAFMLSCQVSNRRIIVKR